MAKLFRDEAVERHRQQLAGSVVIAQPLSFLVLTGFIAGIVLIVGIFVTSAAYARKETVVGFLSPDEGLARVHAPRAGVVGEIYVEEGDFVDEGMPLLTLLGDQVSGDGLDVNAEMLRAVSTQIAELDVQESITLQQIEAERRRLAQDLAGLESERAALQDQLTSQRDLLAKLQSNNKRMHGLVSEGYLSEDSYLAREEVLLTNRQKLASISQALASKTASIESTRLDVERLPLEQAQRVSNIASRHAELTLQKTDLEGRRSVSVAAPISGTIATLRAIPGDSADPQLPLLTILPVDAALEAHLLVPTRAIGFTRPGQEVRLMYEAFDYRRFGVQSGTVSRISSSVFTPAEMGWDVQIAEPSYRITVSIDNQDVKAYGQRFPLQAGMTLRADIILEKRSLLEWLLDPLTSLRGRT